MQISIIKQLVENYAIEELQEAEEAIIEAQIPHINILGKDDGEKLTHTYAAIWILKQMQQNKTDFKTELRNYTKKVRDSIS